MNQSRIKSPAELINSNFVALVGKKHILSSIAYWGVFQSPEAHPFKLEKVLEKVDYKLDIIFDKNINLGYKELTGTEIYELVKSVLMTISEFRDWNLSKYERDNNIKVDDKNRKSFIATDRYSTIDKEQDFIDLTAIFQNIRNSILIKYWNEIDYEDIKYKK